MLDLSKNVVYVGGVVHMEKTLNSVAEAITLFNETQTADLEAVGVAVNKVFNDNKGAFINMAALKTLALNHLNPTSLEAMGVLSQRLTDFIKCNSGEGGAFVVKKARGVGRVADQPTSVPGDSK